MNKHDLADDRVTKLWTRFYEEQGYLVHQVNSKNGKGVKSVNGLIQQACREKIERNRRRGILNRPMRAMIAGIPNVGKSTFINSFAGKACTKTGNKPGVTKGKQWIRLNSQVELLDTPGILWPKFDDQNVGLHLAYIGSIKDELYNMFELGMLLTGYIMEAYPEILSDFYQIDMEDKAEYYLESIAKRRGFLKTGGELDFDKAAKCLVDDYRLGRLGRISLEEPKDIAG